MDSFARGDSRTLSPRHALGPALAVLALIIGWALVIFLVDSLHFVIFDPETKTGVEVILGLASLFVALVLGLFPSTSDQLRLRWVVAGFLCLGFGSLVFGLVAPQVADASDLGRSTYASLVVRTMAALLLVVGLLPRSVVRLSPASILIIPSAVTGVAVAAFIVADKLPTIASPTRFETSARQAPIGLSDLTAWHWVLFSIPLGLAALAMVGSARHYPGRAFGGWLVLALAVLAGASWHNLFWPSGYTPIITTSTVLRLAFTGIVITGGVLELRQISNERASTLSAAREYAQRVTELATFKADFAAIVAHELTTPLAAIRRYADLVSMVQGPLERQQVLEAIHNELDILAGLVADVHTIADVERADFQIETRPIDSMIILEAAAAYARAMPGSHPVRTSPCDAVVTADPERIGQVLRNLLNNAAKYSPPDSPIEMRTRQDGGRVWFEVVDGGFGIPAGELQRIFNKFERGADPRVRRTSGAGLGLYLSCKILETHGAEMVVSSAPGKGSTFRFSLEVAQ